HCKNLCPLGSLSAGFSTPSALLASPPKHGHNILICWCGVKTAGGGKHQLNESEGRAEAEGCSQHVKVMGGYVRTDGIRPSRLNAALMETMSWPGLTLAGPWLSGESHAVRQSGGQPPRRPRQSRGRSAGLI